MELRLMVEEEEGERQGEKRRGGDSEETGGK